MPSELRRFIRKTGLFSIPFLIYGMVIAVVDPYNFLPGPSPIADQLKLETAFKLNYAMWKITAFDKDPAPNLLFGDSRMMSMPTERIEEVAGEPYYNFAYGGGSLREAVDTFHFARGLVPLKRVYFGVNLNTYNASASKDRVSEVLAARRNPLIYLVNTNVMLSTARILWSLVTGRPPAIGVPQADKDEFWKRQIEVTTRVFFGNYRDPVRYREELTEIADICRRDGIELNFIIFPNHMDLEEEIAGFGLTEAGRAFRSDLQQWGTVYDFAFENEMTRDRDNYKDPYHFKTNVKEAVIQAVWAGGGDLVRIYGPAQVAATGEGH